MSSKIQSHKIQGTVDLMNLIIVSWFLLSQKAEK